jgi:hypothetical protein
MHFLFIIAFAQNIDIPDAMVNMIRRKIEADEQDITFT